MTNYGKLPPAPPPPTPTEPIAAQEIKDACRRIADACRYYRVTELPSVRRIEARLLAAITNRQRKESE